MPHMKRRDFITLLGGAAAWPLATRAQQGERMRRIGVLINVVADEQDSLGRLSAFRQALQQLGWSDGGNVRIETRVAKGNPERLRSDSA
jgi:putative tryptophan/tyrosine transport system substrate-binding protein